MLRWSAETLAQRANVSLLTIRRMEKFLGIPSANAKTLSSVQKALEDAGVEFLGDPEVSPGVQLKQLPKNIG